MNQKLSHTQSETFTNKSPIACDLQQQIDTLKQSLKIVAQSLKSEIDKLKLEVKTQHEYFFSKLEAVVSGNKQAENTIDQFNAAITNTIKQALHSIENVKKAQNHMNREIQSISGKKIDQTDLSYSNSHSHDSTTYSKLAHFEKNLQRVEGDIEELRYKCEIMQENSPDLSIFLEYKEKIKEFREEIDCKLFEIEERQGNLDKNLDILQRFEDLEDLISVQRRELFSSVSLLEQKFVKIQFPLRQDFSSSLHNNKF